ncbi:hypothetical protein [Pseudosporangium ferrugineum]|uniref:hypothetical protein n=1 Tax=Pseudosporangium ferrugineum TaxID=439699 RepID=UPI001304FFE4|nr:hypothetical protein [Pseudosporangium ferrugineum]
MSENNLHQLFSTVVAAPPSDTTDIEAAIRVGGPAGADIGPHPRSTGGPTRVST